MTRYFIKIKSTDIGYRYVCFETAYSNDQKVGNLIYRYLNGDITKKESKLLEKIKIDVLVTKDASTDEIIDFFYDNGDSNQTIIEVNKKYVKKANYKIVKYDNNWSDPKKIYLPTFYNELIKYTTHEIFHVFVSGQDYAYSTFMGSYEDDICKIICYEQFNFDKDADDPKFFEAYEAFLEENEIEMRVDEPLTTIIDFADHSCSSRKHKNYITASFEEIFDYINKNLPTSETSE